MSLVKGALFRWKIPRLNYIDQTNDFPLELELCTGREDINIFSLLLEDENKPSTMPQ